MANSQSRVGPALIKRNRVLSATCSFTTAIFGSITKTRSKNLWILKGRNKKIVEIENCTVSSFI